MREIASIVFEYIVTKTPAHVVENGDGLPRRGIRWADLTREVPFYVKERLRMELEPQDLLRALAILVEDDDIREDLAGFWHSTFTI